MTIGAKKHDEAGERPLLPGTVVGPEWLEDHLGHPRLRIVDLRDEEAWVDGHVPGAVQLNLEDLGESLDGCENVLLNADDFEGVMARLGISHRDTVVAYDDHWGLPSARLVWALHHYGGESAGLLNGGWDLWQQEGRPIVGGSRSTGDSASEGTAPEGPKSEGPASEGPAPDRPGFEARPNPDVTADHGWITSRVARADVVLLDTRSHTEFDEGHLPGAVCWDWFNAVPTASWECSREVGELRSELAALGVHPTHEIVTYCRSGMRAAHTWIVLRHAGFERVRLYDGSWQEWNMRDVPDLRGDE